MDVLHASLGVIGRRDVQQPFAHSAPCLGQIDDCERAAYQRQLKFESKHDVQVVGDLVRVDATPPALHAGDGAHKVLWAQTVHARAEPCHEGRMQVLPERESSAQVILEEP